MMASSPSPSNYMNYDPALVRPEDPALILVNWFASSPLLMFYLLGMVFAVDFLPYIFEYTNTIRCCCLCRKLFFITTFSLLNSAYLFLLIGSILYHQLGVLLIMFLGRALSFYLFIHRPENQRQMPQSRERVPFYAIV